MSGAPRSGLLICVVPFFAAWSTALGQATVRGAIEGAQTGLPIRGALVRLARKSVLADSLGRFQFDSVPLGSHTISVRAVGFSPLELDITVHGDTIVRLVAQRSTVVLDTMIVRGRTITVTGTLMDSVTRTAILSGEVTLYPEGRRTGAMSGRFRITDVPAGEPLLLRAAAVEYLPKDIELSGTRDTTIIVYLSVDSVALRMIAQQVRRLATRASVMPSSVDALDRGDIQREGVLSIGELIRRRLPTGVVKPRWPYVDPEKTCVFIDDQPRQFDALFGVVPEVVERVEIFGRDARMIRVYSRRFVAALGRTTSLPKIFYSPNGLHRFCG